jgi:hypothetical protein
MPGLANEADEIEDMGDKRFSKKKKYIGFWHE